MSIPDDTPAKLDGDLGRFRDTGILNRIAGQDMAGGNGTFPGMSPVDKSVICDVAHGTADDIDRAANAAHAAFADWRDMPATQRRKILIRIAEEIALCEC